MQTTVCKVNGAETQLQRDTFSIFSFATSTVLQIVTLTHSSCVLKVNYISGFEGMSRKYS